MGPVLSKSIILITRNVLSTELLKFMFFQKISLQVYEVYIIFFSKKNIDLAIIYLKRHKTHLKLSVLLQSHFFYCVDVVSVTTASR